MLFASRYKNQGVIKRNLCDSNTVVTGNQIILSEKRGIFPLRTYKNWNDTRIKINEEIFKRKL